MPQIPIPLDHVQSGLYLALSNPFVHPTMLAQKSGLIALGGYRAMLAEDLDLWLRGWQAGYKFSRTAGYGILYRSHSGQVTQSEDFLRKAQSEAGLQTLLNNQLKLLSSMGLIGPELPVTRALEAALRKTSPLLWLSGSTVIKKLLSAGNALLGRKS